MTWLKVALGCYLIFLIASLAFGAFVLWCVGVQGMDE